MEALGENGDCQVPYRRTRPETIPDPHPSCDGKNGHPTVFPRDLADRAFGGRHLKAFIGAHPQRATPVPVEDDGLLPDMDTVADCPKAWEIGARNGDWPSKGERDS
ncbi:MAG: hypothetical protein PVF20_08720 [Desulfobacterales bacterium]